MRRRDGLQRSRPRRALETGRQRGVLAGARRVRLPAADARPGRGVVPQQSGLLRGSRPGQRDAVDGAARVLGGEGDHWDDRGAAVHRHLPGVPPVVGGRGHEDEAELPEPNETSISISQSLTYGESLIQPYISPTIRQANETSILIIAHDYHSGWCDLVPTRRIPSFGFEPMMGRWMFNRERNALKLFMGGQDVIREGDEEGDDICLEQPRKFYRCDY